MFDRLLDYLSNLLYWTGCIFALLVVGMGAGIWMTGGSPGFGVFILCAVMAAVGWFIGWGCRWVLAVRT